MAFGIKLKVNIVSDAGEYKIVYYDGVCLLCNSLVIFIIRHDKNDKFRFKTLQSDEMQENNNRLDSVILKDKEKRYYKSEAVIRILYQLNSWWTPVSLLLIFPNFIRDYIYSIIAKNRYKVFGVATQCIVPDDSIKHKFI